MTFNLRPLNFTQGILEEGWPCNWRAVQLQRGMPALPHPEVRAPHQRPLPTMWLSSKDAKV